jgi:phospholipase C
MTTLARREFLKKSAQALGAASAFSALPAVLQRALAIAPNQETGTIQDVKHVVILMQENRSFDHYFGTLRGVRGFGDRIPVPLASGKPVWFQSNGAVEVPPFRLDSRTMNALLVGDVPHTYPDAQAAWNQGKFGEWPRYKTDRSMGHYHREDIPFQFALAEAFTICDAYHCSLTAGTDPNRILFFSGSNSDPMLRKQGINCTAANAEVQNGRCITSGNMPSPGYTFSGTPFNWPTLPELLQDGGISSRVYQDPNDNWSGLMHGALAFENFRKATVDSQSPLYANGMASWSLDDLRSDVVNGTLPAVSWILPSALNSEHPGAGSSPDRAGDFISQVLEALTASADSWSKTAFFLTFDENDGFFDHVPAPAVPSYNADGTLAGKSTLPLDGEYFFDPAREHLLATDTISGAVRPWGLGARVPMYVISPWSKGGWVNSQVYDHSSMGMFLEKRFGISVDSISPWRRVVCGDLTSAFDFTAPNILASPPLPDVSDFAVLEAQQKKLPAAAPPVPAAPLFQEAGTRPSRALPYELHTSARVASNGNVTLLFSNSGTQGAVFHVYDRLHLDAIPRRYTVEAGKLLDDAWDPTAADAGAFELSVYGPCGFLRTFAGNLSSANHATFNPEVQICYNLMSAQVVLKVHNTGLQGGSVVVQANAYRADGPWTMHVAPQSTGSMAWDLAANGQWYDFTATAPGFVRRFAGRIEIGADSISDPAMAQSL